MPLDKYPQRYHDPLMTAISAQANIGWHHLSRGFLTSAWRDLASLHQTKSTQDSSRGHSRILQALSDLHAFTRSLWEGRNDALHLARDTADAAIYSVESAELRHYHSNPHLLPASDQHYCSKSLDQLLRGSPSTRRRWLR